MLIKYQFINGQASEVEVDDGLGETIIQIENDTYNSDRRETRRHESLNASTATAGLTVDVEGEVARRLAAEALHLAISKLNPDERELIQRLYLDKQPISQAEYARTHGTTKKYIKTKAQRTKAKLRKLMSK